MIQIYLAALEPRELGRSGRSARRPHFAGRLELRTGAVNTGGLARPDIADGSSAAADSVYAHLPILSNLSPCARRFLPRRLRLVRAFALSRLPPPVRDRTAVMRLVGPNRAPVAKKRQIPNQAAGETVRAP
jgi:hypothetical protein